jgi:hypothetical protein
MTLMPAALPTSSAPTDLPVVALICNRGSTQNVKHGDWAAPYVASEPHVHVLEARGPGEITEALRQAARLNAKIIAVNGGDGTVDMVFASLLNDKPFATLPMVALLPAGKTNMTAADWCKAADKHAALKALLAARRTGLLKVIHHPILTVDRGDGMPPLRGAFLGAADVVDGILFCRKHIYPMNLPNAVSHALAVSVLLWRSLFTRRDAAVIDARWDAQTGEHGQYFFLSAMTLNRLILGLEPQPATGTGGLHYISLKPGLRAILSVIPRLISKKVPAGFRRNVRRAEKLTLRFDGAYTLDGELYQATKARPVTITAGDTLPFVDLS